MKNILATFLLGSAILLAQSATTNEDVVKMSRSGLSESFILNVIEQQPANFSTDVNQLIQLKNNGVGENIIAAVAKKTPPSEPLTSEGLVRLAKAKFSDSFLLDLLDKYPVKVSTSPTRLAEMKEAGVSERVLSAVLATTKGLEIPQGTPITVRLIDSINSQKDNAGSAFRASLDVPLVVNGETIAPKGAEATVKLIAEDESGKFRGRTVLTIELASIRIEGQDVLLNTSAVSQESDSRGQQTAKSAAAVGAVGAIIGAIAGGGKGAAIGAGAGAAAGAGAQVFLKGERVRIPSEALLTFNTQAPVKVK